ncbi:MAG TPA: phospholipid-binding protein, partial [Xanthomonadales bacterium]|nr:phospholipid-binding protein [Xanthomonadales bacterium]
MKLISHSFRNGGPLPAEFAAGRRDGDSVGFGTNRNPHLAWREIPAAT